MKTPILLVRAAGGLAALRLDQVREIMRPLATTPIAGAPAHVAGMAVVRGRATRIVRLAPTAEAGRWVLLCLPGEPVALAVSETLGIASLESSSLAPLPSSWGQEGAQVAVWQDQPLVLLDAATLAAHSLSASDLRVPAAGGPC